MRAGQPKLSQQIALSDAGRICGTIDSPACRTRLRCRASMNALSIAIGNVLWLASTVSSNSTGKLGCRVREQNHSSFSRTSRRTDHAGSSSSIKARTASFQAPAAINRSSLAVFPDFARAGRRVHARAMTRRMRSEVIAAACLMSSASSSKPTSWVRSDSMVRPQPGFDSKDLCAAPRVSSGAKPEDGTDQQEEHDQLQVLEQKSSHRVTLGSRKAELDLRTP
jgi:hypothetical protein